MNEKLKQIKTVFADEAFVKTCLEAENEAAVQKLLADKGVEMSLTEIELMKEMAGAMANGTITEEQLEMLAQCGELSEDELAQAAGGFGKSWKAIDKSGIFNKLFGKEAGFAGDYDLVEFSGAKVGSVAAAGIIVACGAAYGICKACGVDVEGGVSKAWNWVSDKVTSRW